MPAPRRNWTRLKPSSSTTLVLVGAVAVGGFGVLAVGVGVGGMGAGGLGGSDLLGGGGSAFPRLVPDPVREGAALGAGLEARAGLADRAEMDSAAVAEVREGRELRASMSAGLKRPADPSDTRHPKASGVAKQNSHTADSSLAHSRIESYWAELIIAHVLDALCTFLPETAQI